MNKPFNILRKKMSLPARKAAAKKTKEMFIQEMKKSIQQAKKGKTRTVSSEELDRWEKELENENI